MTFGELLQTVTFDDVWAELNKEYSLQDGALEAYLRVFHQLRELTPEPNHNGCCLAVVTVEDMFEPGLFIHDVFGVKPQDKEHYAIEMLPWKEWLSLTVIEKCMETYGAVNVVAHALYELTFFGYDVVEVETRIDAHASPGEHQQDLYWLPGICYTFGEEKCVANTG